MLTLLKCEHRERQSRRMLTGWNFSKICEIWEDMALAYGSLLIFFLWFAGFEPLTYRSVVCMSR